MMFKKLTLALGLLLTVSTPLTSRALACEAHMPPINQSMTYGQARKVIMNNSWYKKAVRWQEATQWANYNRARTFWDSGFTEVQDCSGTGIGLCWFVFVDARGNELEIVTAGEVEGSKTPGNLPLYSWTLSTHEKVKAREVAEAAQEEE